MGSERPTQGGHRPAGVARDPLRIGEDPLRYAGNLLMVGGEILTAGGTTGFSPRLCITGILFAVTMMGPGLAYGLGSLMLRLYVDIDRMPEGEPPGTQRHLRGACAHSVTDPWSFRSHKTRNP